MKKSVNFVFAKLLHNDAKDNAIMTSDQ